MANDTYHFWWFSRSSVHRVLFPVRFICDVLSYSNFNLLCAAWEPSEAGEEYQRSHIILSVHEYELSYFTWTVGHQLPTLRCLNQKHRFPNELLEKPKRTVEQRKKNEQENKINYIIMRCECGGCSHFSAWHNTDTIARPFGGCWCCWCCRCCGCRVRGSHHCMSKHSSGSSEKVSSVPKPLAACSVPI